MLQQGNPWDLPDPGGGDGGDKPVVDKPPVEKPPNDKPATTTTTIDKPQDAKKPKPLGQVSYWNQPTSQACMLGALGNPERFAQVYTGVVGTYGAATIPIPSSTGYGSMPAAQYYGIHAGGAFGRALGLNTAATVAAGETAGIGLTGATGIAAAGMAGWALGSAVYCYGIR